MEGCVESSGPNRPGAPLSLSPTISRSHGDSRSPGEKINQNVVIS